ncbi:MAG: Wzz/FepE/Etk N-terminal domain-containing protein, partial [Vicinamibacterales bacterium]
MNRVTDAMRRAGQHHDEPPEIHTGDMPFANGDEAAKTEAPVPLIGAAMGANAAASEGAEPVPSPGAIQVQNAQISPLPPYVEATEDVQVQEMVRVLLRRIPMICGIVVVAVAGAAFYNYMATPIYEARARVVIEPESGQVVPFQGIGNDPSRDDYLITQLEVLRSRSLAQATLERLRQLPKEPNRQSGQIDMLLGGLSVRRDASDSGLSRVVNIFYTGTNPQVAARMANAVARTYVDRNIEVRKSLSREATNLLNQRLKELRQEVSSSE